MADHFLRGVVLPRSMYGVDVVGAWRWLEHSGYVVFEDLILIPSCILAIRERQSVSIRQAELEFTDLQLRQTQDELELRVAARTFELSAMNGKLSEEISERTRGEDALKLAEALLSGVLTSAMDGVMAFESLRDSSGEIRDFRLLMSNPAAERMVGKTAEETG